MSLQSTDPLLSDLVAKMESAANPDKAAQMSAYLKHQFPFYGIPAPERKAISAGFVKAITSSPSPFQLILSLFQMPERELHYVAVEAAFRCKKRYDVHTIVFLEELITMNSWWDTVDSLSAQSVGFYMKQFPSNNPRKALEWIENTNMWLRRTALLFQLKYRDSMDTDLLAVLINKTRHENEFFIRKAIGWILREYAKYNPAWVLDFVERTELKPLSRKEALKHFK